MREIVIFGGGDIAQLADFYFSNDSNRRVAAFTVDATFKQGDHLFGKPLVAFEEAVSLYPPDRYEIFVAIAYTKLNKLRADKVAEAKAKGYRLASYVSTRATVFPGFEVGENCFILEDNTIQPFATVGNNVTLWSGNHIGHHSTIEDDVFIASHVVVSGGVRIGQACFVGVNVTIRDHVSIGARSVLGAGALVLSDVPDKSVLSPAATEISKVPSDRLRGI